jgi:hypothetical protein
LLQEEIGFRLDPSFPVKENVTLSRSIAETGMMGTGRSYFCLGLLHVIFNIKFKFSKIIMPPNLKDSIIIINSQIPCFVVYHHVLVSTQNGSRTLISDQNSEVSTGMSREYSGSNKNKQGLPQ